MKIENSRVIVTGANGFLGASFLRALDSRGNSSILGLTRGTANAQQPLRYSQTDYSEASLTRIFQEFKPDFLIHAAGPASVASSVKDPQNDHAGSVELTERILSALRKAKSSPRIYYTSTAAVYGNPERLPISEDDSVRPISPYGKHRYQAENLILDFARDTGSPAFIGRAFSIFGAEQKKLVLWEIAQQALSSNQIILHGSGLETRDYLSTENYIARALRLLESEASESAVVNVASGVNLTIISLAKKITELLGVGMPIVARNEIRPGEPQRWAANIERYRKLTGDLSTPSFEEDLKSCLLSWRGEKN